MTGEDDQLARLPDAEEHEAARAEMAVGLVLLRAQYLRDEALAVVRVGRGEVRDHIRAVDADPGLRENPLIVQDSDGSAQA